MRDDCVGVFVAVACPWPGDPPHGYADGSQNAYRPGEHVSISCEPYYVLDGQPKLVCRDDGRWSAPMPICKFDTPCDGKKYGGEGKRIGGPDGGHVALRIAVNTEGLLAKPCAPPPTPRLLTDVRVPIRTPVYRTVSYMAL